MPANPSDNSRPAELRPTVGTFVVVIVSCALALLPSNAYSQVRLSGAILFSSDSRGAASGGIIFNTLGGDYDYNLWLSRDPDATMPINGPADTQAGIEMPLSGGAAYKMYGFGQPGPETPTGWNGLNLFFDGHANPDISLYGSASALAFVADNQSTLTLQGASVAGSGKTFYSANGVTVVATEFVWRTQLDHASDLCQSHAFSPGGGADFYGSFSLGVWRSAALTVSPSGSSPGTPLRFTGTGFGPAETVDVYARRIDGTPDIVAATDDTGSFVTTAQEAQAPLGQLEYFAVGRASGRLGAASISVTPRLAVTPAAGAPGGTVLVRGYGFGAGEQVQVYWDNPRRSLGTATANTRGTFSGSSGLNVVIPPSAPPGPNQMIAIGQTTHAVGLGVTIVGK